jgi:hypothetical protein
MAVVTDLDAMGGSTTPLTDDQLHSFLNKLTLKIFNVMHGDGYLGAVDYEEMGDTGHRVYFAQSLAEMRKQHEYFSKLLANPELRGDFGFFLTQNQPPNMVTGYDDSYRLQ